MAPSSRPHHSFCMNPPINSADNELISNPPRALTQSSGSLTPISWLFSCDSIPRRTLNPALTYALIKYTIQDLERVTRFALKSFL